MTGLDVATDTTGHAHELAAWFKAQGVDGAIGIYLRPDRCSKAMVDGLHAVRAKVWSIWEAGHPTSSKYFTAAQGMQDGLAAGSFAHAIGQPQGTWILSTFDYDSSDADIRGCNLVYAGAFRTAISNFGYHMGAYGNGALLQFLTDRGLISKSHLSESAGFNGYQDFLRKASIVQMHEATVCGFDVDVNLIRDEEVCW